MTLCLIDDYKENIIYRSKKEVFMDKLFEYLTSKIGFTLYAIIGFILPGVLFIFVWNRTLFLEIDVFKLILLSISISLPFFIVNLFIIIISNIVKEKLDNDCEDDETLINILGVCFVISYIEMFYGIIRKIYDADFLISNFISQIKYFESLCIIVIFLPAIIILIYRKVKRESKIK